MSGEQTSRLVATDAGDSGRQDLGDAHGSRHRTCISSGWGGRTYPVKISGVSVAEVGFTKAEATGSVYNLKSIEDFDGVYAAAGAEGTAGKGAGVSSLRNTKGVVINLKSETKGANIKIAGEGLKLEIER